MPVVSTFSGFRVLCIFYPTFRIQQKAYEIIRSHIDTQEIVNFTVDTDFINIGFDSITFIKTVVALECEFDFEFDDEMLLITKFPTVKSMVAYVESKTAI